MWGDRGAAAPRRRVPFNRRPRNPQIQNPANIRPLSLHPNGTARRGRGDALPAIIQAAGGRRVLPDFTPFLPQAPVCRDPRISPVRARMGGAIPGSEAGPGGSDPEAPRRDTTRLGGKQGLAGRESAASPTILSSIRASGQYPPPIPPPQRHRGDRERGWHYPRSYRRQEGVES